MVTPARRGKRKKYHSVDEADQTPAEIRASIMTQIFCSHFGNGMADLISTSRFGEKPSCIRPIFRSVGAKLTSLHVISIE
jgi:hypothetical protein